MYGRKSLYNRGMSSKSPAPALSYLRVSGRGQVEGDGFARQREAIGRFARASGYAIEDEYRDEGVSGTKDLGDRPGLAALLDRIESNGIRVVLVERADRLARDLMVSEVILDQFARVGARVLTADGVDLTNADDDPTRTLIRQVLAAVAQFDKSVTVLKLRAARQRVRCRAGRCEGRKPFGTRPGEDQTLALMKELRRKPRGGTRLSFGAIARRLSAEGHPTRSGRPWAPGSVHAILTRSATK